MALTRGRISQATSLITQLQQESSPLENGDHANVNQVSRDRAAAVAKLSSDLELFESMFFSRIVQTEDDLDPEQGVEFPAVRRGNGDQSIHGDQLDHILGTATHLKEIGYEINDEIGVHVRLLDEIDAREEALLSKQANNDKLLSKWMLNKSGAVTWLWGIVVFLFFALFYVLML